MNSGLFVSQNLPLAPLSDTLDHPIPSRPLLHHSRTTTTRATKPQPPQGKVQRCWDSSLQDAVRRRTQEREVGRQRVVSLRAEQAFLRRQMQRRRQVSERCHSLQEQVRALQEQILLTSEQDKEVVFCGLQKNNANLEAITDPVGDAGALASGVTSLPKYPRRRRQHKQRKQSQRQIANPPGTPVDEAVDRHRHRHTLTGHRSSANINATTRKSSVDHPIEEETWEWRRNP